MPNVSQSRKRVNVHVLIYGDCADGPYPRTDREPPVQQKKNKRMAYFGRSCRVSNKKGSRCRTPSRGSFERAATCVSHRPRVCLRRRPFNFRKGFFLFSWDVETAHEPSPSSIWRDTRLFLLFIDGAKKNTQGKPGLFYAQRTPIAAEQQLLQFGSAEKAHIKNQAQRVTLFFQLFYVFAFFCNLYSKSENFWNQVFFYYFKKSMFNDAFSFTDIRGIPLF